MGIVINKKKKKMFLLSTIISIVVSFTIGCSDESPSKEAVLKNDYGYSIDKNLVKTEYSQNFDIEYFDNYKVINVFSADERHKLIFQYLLLPEEAAVPDEYTKAMIVRTPVKSVISLTSLYIGFLEKLGLLDKVIAVDKFQYVISSKMWNLINAGKVTEVGESYSPNIEKIFELKPGLILTYGNGNPYVDGNPKLIEFGIKVASTTIHLENSPLARAEWIKFIAAFFNMEKKANEIFNGIAKRYNKLVQLTKNVKQKPTVFTEALFGGMWYEPGGKSYMAKLLNDAGADYLWKDDQSTGSLKLTYEQVYERARSADYWINVLFWNKISDALKNDPRNSKFKAFRTRNIFNNNVLINKYGYYEYWENGVINCDLVLADLIKIFHPHLLPDYKMKYYKKLQDK